MNLPLALNMTLTGMLTVCLMWPAAIRAYNNMDRYGKNQLMQKQNRYSSPAWYKDVNRASGWVSRYDVAGGTGGSGLMSGNYGRRLGDDEEMIEDDDGMIALNQHNNNNNMLLSLDDYYYDDTADVGPYGPSRPYDRLDYAVVRYPPSYGYYPLVDDLQVTEYDMGAPNNKLVQYENGQIFGNRNPVVSPAAAVSSALSSYYTPPVQASGVINGYLPPPSPPITLNRGYETTRYPMDKLHRFRKVFMSNLVSPSNVFKTPEERQVYDFWESLINDDLKMGTDVNRITTADRRVQMTDQNNPQSPLFQHLSPVFQRLQKQQQKFQKNKQQHQQQYHHHKQQKQFPSQQQAQKLVQYQKPAEERKSHSTGSLFNQWANGSPFIKRSFSVGSGTVENDDVQQLENLKTNKGAATDVNMTDSSTTATVRTTTDITPTAAMTDGGQKEYVLPRPAGEKSGLESLFEVIAEGGLRGNYDRNATADSDYNKVSTPPYITINKCSKNHGP